jgi:8-oxo-dGTP pyrophosphatase MutT (NUDIX family)|tara:strand:- start:988 stop:1500 length:513 start_codon:yes stop_codon:yes gene_type:complete
VTATAPSFVPEENVGIRTSAAILVTPDGRYLMQLRDADPQTSFPDTLCLFGGALEEGEGPEAGLRRELREELELEAGGIRYFTQLVFDAIYDDGGLRQRYYFEVPIEPDVVGSLVLHEGAGMRMMTAEDVAKESFRFVPYDFGILRMHMLLWRNDGKTLGAENGLSANRS